MLNCLKPRRSLLLVPVTLLQISVSQPAHAFDTGPHHDLTRAALEHEGFAPGSPVVKVAQVANYLVDHYSAPPFALGGLEHLHFDNHVSTAQIRNSWNRLSLNTRNAVRAAVASVRAAPNAAERYERLVHLAVLIGASLHPVQDFYSHSNWVETYPMQGGAYGTATWFDTPSPSLSLHTGRVAASDLNPTRDPARDHGDYDRGMNHDNNDRPRWPEAYVYAYSASRQWLRAIRQWIEAADPAVWRDLLALQMPTQDRAMVEIDLSASSKMSLWLALGGKDGAWKGSGSGDLAGFAAVYSTWGKMPNSIVVRRFKDAAAYRPLASDMHRHDTDPGPAPAIPRVALGRRAVEVRTVRAITSGSADPSGEADLYGVVFIQGQRYVEATQQGHNDIEPRWLSIGFVPTSTTVVQMRYELYDEDGGLNGDPDPIDIHPGRGRTHAEFQLDVRRNALSGDLDLAISNTPGMGSTQGGGGDPDPGGVILSVTARDLREPSPAP